MPPMENKTVLVTGASSGIGQATAVGLAKLGARLILQGRTPSRCAEALAAVRAVAKADVDFIEADLSTADGVAALAEQTAKLTDHLDVLINNAGVTMLSRETTSEGFERTIAVNHLGYFRTTGHLLPLLRKATSARIVNVASEAHRFGTLDLDDLDNEKSFSGMRVYGQSKGANLLFNVELARRLEGSNITTNALHPGGIRSNLGRGQGPLLNLVHSVVSLFLKSPEEGAKTSIFLASAQELEGVSGRYFAKCREKQAAEHAIDPSRAKQLWDLSEQRTGLRYP